MFLKTKMKAHFPENVLFSLRELRLIAPLQQRSRGSLRHISASASLSRILTTTSLWIVPSWQEPITLSASISSVRLTNLSTANGNPGEIIAHDAGSGIYEALVAPQSMTAGTTFITITTADGKTYVYRMQQDADWDAGAEYEYGINIK